MAGGGGAWIGNVVVVSGTGGAGACTAVRSMGGGSSPLSPDSGSKAINAPAPATPTPTPSVAVFHGRMDLRLLKLTWNPSIVVATGATGSARYLIRVPCEHETTMRGT